MIPRPGCDPKINVIRIGADILLNLQDGPNTIGEILIRSSKKFGVSVDHIILSLDWLYAISTIELKNDQIFINEIK